MSLLDGNLGFIALAKTKIDQTFPTARFTKTGYKKTYRLDITSKKGDSYLMLKHIPSKQVISPELPSERLSINAVIHESMFPESLRYADITSTFKKENEIGKAIYRSTCLLPSISKILEKVRYVQTETFVNKELSSLLCGFSPKYITQHTLFDLFQDW